jgi:hypothetical protein
MARYKYATTSSEEKFCNGEIWANSDEQAIVIAKEAKAQVVFKAIIKDAQIVGWERIYYNPSAIKH